MNNMDEKNWIAVSADFSIRRYLAPFYEKSLHLWIHQKYDRHYDVNTPLFTYELYSPELIGLKMRTGNFTCLRIFDHCHQAGCGTHCSVSIEIEDEDGAARCFGGFMAGELGVTGAIRFMQQFRRIKNWADYDEMSDLVESLETSFSRLNAMITEVLTGTGIALI